ncbi:unnamed protein product [Phytophthora fragariaefolia]|uniref:Unnamed protein product n=1 Tax=Phytophthora fragariaefolia TaxID=1490495 RepID=A0A9W6X394_9STRA|nr:unnamed protein product [Phytophthora fragariaefolia]
MSYQLIDESALERARAARQAHWASHAEVELQDEECPTGYRSHAKGCRPTAEKSLPKETMPQRTNGATSTDSKSHAKKSSPTKAQAPATATAPSAKSRRPGLTSARRCACQALTWSLPPPRRESDTDTPNPDLITGDEDSTADSTTPGATKPSEGRLASANTTASEPAPVEEAPIPSPDVSSNARKEETLLNSSDTQDSKGSASATPPAKAPQERSPPPEDGPDPVDYEVSEPDQDREQGDAPDPNSAPQLTEQQRVTHPGRPMTPKTTAAVAPVEDQAQSKSHRDTAPTDMPEQQIITNAGIDEGGPLEQLQYDNQRHLSERTHQDASRAAGTKREREAPRGSANSCSHCDIGHSSNIANTCG